MENEICSICHEDLNGTLNILTTKCNHKFHTDCYMKYMNSSRKSCCPMCRQNVFEGIIEINNSNRVSRDDVIYQLRCQVVSLKTEIFILSSQNKSLLEKLNQQTESSP